MSEDNYILFERYLNGELNQEEARDFEQRLKDEDVFANAFEEYREMMGFLDEKVEKEDALDVLREVHGDVATTKSRIVNIRFFRVAIASVLLILIGFFVVNEYKENKRVERIMAMYEFPPNKGGRSVDMAQTKLDSAIWYFDLRDFDNSEILFLEILEQDPTNQEANRYMGHISFLNEEFIGSREYFEKLNRYHKQDSITISLLENLKS